MACSHDKVDGSVNLVRNAKGAYRIDMKLNCQDCGVPFQFGESFVSSSDGLELTAIVAPGPRKENKPLTVMATEILKGF